MFGFKQLCFYVAPISAVLVIAFALVGCGNSAIPATISADELVTGDITIPGQAVPIKAYEARPDTDKPLPALIVIHENRGLTEHIKDVTRRFAGQGYVALAPDLLSRIGGREKFATDDDAAAGINTLTSEGVQQDLQSTFDYLKGRP